MTSQQPKALGLAPPPGRLAKRLLVGGICMASMIIGVVCIERVAVHQTDHKLALGHDLLPSYVAGTFVHEGRPRDMYDIDAVHREEAHIVKSADLLLVKQGGPWLNPPFFALFFAPLSALPYRQAAAVFLAINLTLLSGSIWLLRKQLPVLGWRTVLLPLLMCTSMPFWQAMTHQQNTFISLFLLSLAITFWSRNAMFITGAVSGLLFFKPQLALALAVVLVITGGRRAVAGILLTNSALVAVTLLALPGTLGDYLVKLPPILHALQYAPSYNWGRQVTLQSFWRLLCEGHSNGPLPLLPAILIGVSAAGIAVSFGATALNVMRVRGLLDHPAPAESYGGGYRLDAAADALLHGLRPAAAFGASGFLRPRLARASNTTGNAPRSLAARHLDRAVL